MCGENSPVVDSVHVGEVYFHELNVNGLPNVQGLSINAPGGVAKMLYGDTAYELRVRDGRMIGVLGASVLRGQQLVGATIPVSTHSAWSMTQAERVASTQHKS
jgi:hypothetical protein